MLCESEVKVAVQEAINGKAAWTLFQDSLSHITFHYRNGVLTVYVQMLFVRTGSILFLTYLSILAEIPHLLRLAIYIPVLQSQQHLFDILLTHKNSNIVYKKV